jgi:hypothetical protein
MMSQTKIIKAMIPKVGMALISGNISGISLPI